MSFLTRVKAARSTRRRAGPACRSAHGGPPLALCAPSHQALRPGSRRPSGVACRARIGLEIDARRSASSRRCQDRLALSCRCINACYASLAQLGLPRLDQFGDLRRRRSEITLMTSTRRRTPSACSPPSKLSSTLAKFVRDHRHMFVVATAQWMIDFLRSAKGVLTVPYPLPPLPLPWTSHGKVDIARGQT
jgi:hypothetical protein